MRRMLIVVLLFCAGAGLFARAVQPPANPQAVGAVAVKPATPQAPPSTPVPSAPAKAPAKAPAPFTLSVDSIMQGPKLLGTPPSGIRWAPDSSKVYFSWQKPGEDRANTWVVNRDGSDLKQLTQEEARTAAAGPNGRPDAARKRLLTAENGNIVIYDAASGARWLVTRTASAETSPRWARRDTAVTFMRDGNLYLLSLDGGGNAPAEVQLTDVVATTDAAGAAAAAAGRGAAAVGAATGGRGGVAGAAQAGGRGGTDQNLTDSQRALRDEERNLIEFLKKQAEQRQQAGRGGGGVGAGRGGGRGGPGGAGGAGAGAAEIIARFQPTLRQSVTDMLLSADEAYVYISVTERPEIAARSQDVPTFITESAYPEMTNGRSNVGDSQSCRLLAILDLKQNRVTWADGSTFAGNEKPVKPAEPAKPVEPAMPVDPAKPVEAAKPVEPTKPAEPAKPASAVAPKPAEGAQPRLLDWGLPDCSDNGARCVTSVRSQDFKDRWLVMLDPATGKATPLDTLHDEAWIREGSVSSGTGGGGFGGGGFGGGGVAWLPDNKRFVFMSERDGWMHLYSLDAAAPKPAAKQLTSGKWEVASARLSSDRTTLFFAASEVHPGERHFYTIPVDGGAFTRVTTMTGSSEVTVSPDEKSLAVVYSYTTKPPELFVMPFTAGAPAKQITTTPTQEWLAYKWIDSKVMTFKARDGALVYARLYTPEMVGAKRDPKHPAVVFVHGAGYLQFVTKSWSSNYYREHMFHQLLAKMGYVVIAPDYRASAGYGRDWRTGIHLHMGGKDLDDAVDAARYLVAAEKVDPKRIGIYGGSYGGFLTLMALFTTPDVFAAGAALRPVTDWSHYNHSYTAPILNLPQTDPEAYRRSSPIYFVDGLKNQLLICHGMVDSNVFFQDTVRLIQRLIEKRKDNWSVAPYPVENHSFTEETSWADEYKRILKLFEQYLRR